MRPGTTFRCAVLVLAILLAIDASWCSDAPILVQPSLTAFLAIGNAVCDDDGGQLDCHSCICSGLALVENTPLHAPPLPSTWLAAIAAGNPVSHPAPVDIPPDKRG